MPDGAFRHCGDGRDAPVRVHLRDAPTGPRADPVARARARGKLRIGRPRDRGRRRRRSPRDPRPRPERAAPP
jgi:hypothetical protein